MAERDDSRPGSETRERILDAAEALFAEHGFEATSMRLVTSQAGVNLAAVNYHFGNKEGLFQAVFHRRLGQLNRARLDALDRMEAEAGGVQLKPSRIVTGFFGPALAMAADVEGGGQVFMRLLSRTYTDPAAFIRQFIANEFAEVVERYTSALFRALPDVPRDEIVWRLHFMLGAVSYAMSGIDAMQLVAGRVEQDPHKLGPRLMSFLLGGLRAPLPDDLLVQPSPAASAASLTTFTDAPARPVPPSGGPAADGHEGHFN